MTPEQWRQISAVFHDALARPPEARQAFVDAACAERDVRAAVERLLAAHRNAGTFGESPVFSRRTAAAPAESVGPAAAPSAAPRRTTTGPSTPRPARRFALVAWLAAAAVAAVFAYAAWLLIERDGNTRSFGWEAGQRAGNWYVTEVAPDGPGAGELTPGDRMLSVNGVPVLPDAGPFYGRRDLAVGSSYTLVIEREGQRLEPRLTVGSRTNTDELVYYLVSFVWCAVGLFIALARPEAVLARLAAATAVATGVVFLQAGVIQGGPLWQPLHAVLGFHFLARFPTDRPTRGAWRVALAVAYIGGAFAAALALLLQGVSRLGSFDAGISLLSEWSWLYVLRQPIGLAAFGVAVLGMVLALGVNYRRVTGEDQRRRIRWVVYGSIIALVPQVWWTTATVIAVLVPYRPPRFDLFANAFTAVIPLVMAYAVVKHRVLDIGVVIRRGVQYLLAKRALQAAVVLPFAALLYIVISNRHLTLGELVSETGAYLFWLVLAGVALKFRQPLGVWLDRRFFREQYDRERLMMQLLDESRRVESLTELSRLVTDTLVASLHSTHAAVWYRDPRERALSNSSGAAARTLDLPADERWLSWLEQRGTLASLPLIRDAGLSHDDLVRLEGEGVDAVVPIADSSDRLIGALVLGPKKSEEPYDDNDSQFLGAVARQIAMVRENLRLRARLTEEVRVRRDVLARLDESLPDILKECPLCGACFSGDIEQCANDGRALVLSLPISRTIDGRYVLDRLLGKGGMGAVYEGRDLRLQRVVAVKVMLSRAFGQPGALRRFRREARAAAQLSHRNIVTVYDVGSLEGDGAYIVMERVPGETLRAALARERHLTPAAVLEWFEPLLEAIGTAHSRGIVHRDLKPENVMGHRDGAGALHVKILDLGLVKLPPGDPSVSGTVTLEKAVMGTPDYMSPEQLLARQVDQRADLFAVGVMLVEALTGSKTLPSEPHAEATQRSGPAPAVALSPALWALLRQCLAADAHDRPESAAALRDQLVPLLRANDAVTPLGSDSFRV